MSFDVSAQAYQRFMGRFSIPLSEQFLAWVGVRAGERVLDVGCGPGALTALLAERLGPEAVVAVDPSASFRAAVRTRLAGVDVRAGVAEDLPLPDDSVDTALAQLVVHFMTDPLAGLREMARVVRPGGIVAACVWDHAGDAGPLAPFWAAVRDLDTSVPDESGLAGVREGQLARLCSEAGLSDIESSALLVTVYFESVEDWWEPFTFGVGPAGAYVASLGPEERERLRVRCAEGLPSAPFDQVSRAWCVRARPGRDKA